MANKQLNYTAEEINDILDKAKTIEIPDIPTKLSDLENDSNFISSVPSEYITESELNNKGYATQTYITQLISGLQNQINSLQNEIETLKNNSSNNPPTQDLSCTNISLNMNSLTLDVDNTYTLVATLTPSNTTDNLYWTSNDIKVATVSVDGLVVAKGSGNCTITAICGNKTATCMITVNAKEVEDGGDSGGEVANGLVIGYVPIENEDTTLATNNVIVSSATQLTSALNSIKAGQTIYLRNGNYNIGEHWISTTGTQTQPIVIRNYPNEKPILKGSKLKMNADLSYITIKGLTITDVNLTGNDVWDNAISIGAGNSHIIIEDNEFYNLTSEGGTENESGLQAIYVSGDMNESTNSVNNCIIRNNYIHDCATGWSEAIMLEGNVTDCEVYNNTIDNTGNIGIDVAGNYDWLGTVGDANNQARNITIYNNLVMNCQSEYATAGGIYSDGARNITIDHNIIYNCQGGIEIGAEEPGYQVENFYVHNNLLINNGRSLAVGGYQSTSATHRNTFVYNNTIIGGDWYADDSAMIAIYRTTNFQAYNNIFYAQSGNSLIENEAGTFTFNNNCWYQQGLSSLPSGEGKNSFVNNPQFVNYTNTLEGDYTLQTNSPCLDKGSYNVTYCGTFDLNGGQRVNNIIDIGCYEK